MPLLVMRYLAALLLVGCASGQSAVAPGDGDISMLPDAETPADAPADAEPHVPDDAPPDARPDAPPDAPPAVPPDAAMPDAYVCQVMTMQLLQNPALDLTPVGTGWVQQNIDNAYPIITADGIAPQSAPYKAWMGGFVATSGTLTDQLYQDVMVPAGTTQLRLTGYYLVGTEETSTTMAFDTAQVGLTETNGTPIETALSLSNLSAVGTWTAFDKTFTTNQSGKTVRLRFTSTTDNSFNTNFFFDTLTLTATYCQ